MPAPDELHCEECARSTAYVSIVDSALMLGVAEQTIRLWLTAGQVHSKGRSERGIYICMNSLLLRAVRRPPARDERIRQTLIEIQQKFSQKELRVTALAESVRLSRWHLARMFKKETGIGIRQYLRLARILRASELLSSAQVTVKEVAASVGYRHVSDFDHEFRRIFGTSPREYRARTRGETSPAS